MNNFGYGLAQSSKGFFESGGAGAVVGFAIDVYGDCQTYGNNPGDLALAVLMSAIGTVAAFFASAVIVSFGAPVAFTILATVVVCGGIAYYTDKSKEELIGY